MKTITILGLGAMGSRMAENLLKSGYALNIWNRTPEKCKPLAALGAQVFPDASGAVKNADVIISMLTDDQASKHVWLDSEKGALAGLNKQAIAIECSTLTPEWSRELASKITEAGAQFIEALVIGSRPQVENAQLIHLIGGEKKTLDKVKDVLNVSAAAMYYMGEVGTAMSMKLAVNGLFGVQVAALSEMLGMLNAVGIDKNAALDLFAKLPITSPALVGVGAGISANNYQPLFPINLVEKDFAYLLQLAKNEKAAVPMIGTALGVYQNAQQAGLGESNISAVAQMYL